MNPASNFACYRTMFKVATESKGGRVSVIFPLLAPASIQNSPRQGFANSVRLLFYFQFEFTIPFFSLFVKDVYFLNEGHSNRLRFFFPVCSFFLKCFMYVVFCVYLIYLCFLLSFYRLPNGDINFEVNWSFLLFCLLQICSCHV